MYLNQGYVSFFTIHLGYNYDTMYLNPQIHGTQDTLTIHVGYIGDTFEDTYLEPYLWPRESCMYPVSPSFQVHLSLDAFEIHVSRMYPACIPHVSRMYLDDL